MRVWPEGVMKTKLTVVFKELNFRLGNVVGSFKRIREGQGSGTRPSCVQWMMKHKQGVRCSLMIAARRGVLVSNASVKVWLSWEWKNVFFFLYWTMSDCWWSWWTEEVKGFPSALTFERLSIMTHAFHWNPSRIMP